DQQTRLRSMNRRSYYRWILRLATDNSLKIIYTPGHSSEVSIPARMNFEADHYASSAQHHRSETFTAPIPTFFMDDYTFYTRDDGWIESNIRTYVKKAQILEASKYMKAPPEYCNMMAYSACSAIVQHYARSGQLPTADVLYSRQKLSDARCRMRCEDIEDQHHIFIQCPCYDEMRTKAADELFRCTNSKLAELGIEEVDRVDLLTAAKSFFSDNESIWPLHY
ncbi:hypothetical protein B0H17DRAFT_903016, partial [Mycena rosella]